MRAMQQQVQKLKVKSAFLLQNLLVGHPEHKGGLPLPGEQTFWGGCRVAWGLSFSPAALPLGTLCSMGMVQQLVALVRTEHSPFHEHVLGALCRCAGPWEDRPRVPPRSSSGVQPPPHLGPGLGTFPEGDEEFGAREEQAPQSPGFLALERAASLPAPASSSSWVLADG